jgi:indolepyruvate ferredoxin oxidoreductase
MDRDAIALDDKYTQEAGDIYLSGIQALVRLPLMQQARDAAAGLRTAGFISGYRGSPLAGLDQQLWEARRHLEARDIVFQPGLNEELAATAVWGSQQTGLRPGARYDGVFGLWYGKAPGVDRAQDALRHANAAGTARHGGVLLVAGDDHACKSSSYPTQSEFAMMHIEAPVLAPASVQDVLDYGLHGWAMSRYSGLWVSLVALTDIMDGSAVVRVGDGRAPSARPLGFEMPPEGVHIRRQDSPLAQEQRIREIKLPAALAYARAANLNRIVFDTGRPRLVIVASGKAYTDTRQALHDMGIDGTVAAEIGIRLVKIGMPWPLDRETLRACVAGADKVLVIEEKRAVIESQLKEQLYDLPDELRPRIVGKRDEQGAPMLAEIFELDAIAIARAIALQLPAGVSTDRIDDYVAMLVAREILPAIAPSTAERVPFFCSGCPHNTSTRLPEGSRALAGIGCHYMVQWMDRETDHFSQMGGEGAAWLGQASFTDEDHVFVNLGDGTYFHSGVLAIRAAVAAGAHMTYKLLYNGAVAMTGGQPHESGQGVPEITRQLAAEGVGEIVIVSDDPKRYAGDAGLAPGVRVHPRSELDCVQQRLRDTPGVTVLIYDQACAAQQRRKRKRGLIDDPSRRIFINELVCEGCGDCSKVSNCLSIEPVETELGRKRRINQSSCNKDFSCVDGSCPAFVSVTGGALRRRPLPDWDHLIDALPAPPSLAVHDVYNVVLAGVGGTGVTTVAALVGMAAHLEGRASAVLDMTGLAQKGGAVISHVRLADRADAIHGGRVPARSADLLLACDPVVAAGASGLEYVSNDRTRTFLNTHVAATGAFVMDNAVRHDETDMQDRLRRASSELHAIDATEVAEGMLGEAIGGNLLLLGFAFQMGRVPLRLESIHRAIELNGVAVAMNRRAFALGRILAHDEKLVDDWKPSTEMEPVAAALAPSEEEALEHQVTHRESHLDGYQDAAYAARYRHWVERIQVVEAKQASGSHRLTRAVAKSLFQLMAYKDEYEVARLYTDGRFRERLEREFEGDFEVSVHLAPPAFARRDALGGRLIKRTYGAWIFPVMRVLAKLKTLRGTPLDPFGWLAERRHQRAALAEFEALLERLVEDLSPTTYDVACRLAELPQRLRGFDRVRDAAVDAQGDERAQLLAELERLSAWD